MGESWGSFDGFEVGQEVFVVAQGVVCDDYGTFAGAREEGLEVVDMFVFGGV